jgi:hypothetical protein
MKKFFQIITFTAIALFSVNAASAQNPMLKSPLTFTDLGTTVQVCFDIAGLGNVSQTKLSLTFTAVVTTECTNQGGNVAPGLTRTVQTTQDFLVAVSNGRATGCVVSTEPAAGKCPNGNFTADVTDAQFSNVSVTIGKKTFKL